MTYQPQPAPVVTPPTGPAGTATSTLTTPTRIVNPHSWPGGRALTASPLATVADLDLDQNVGQRQATWSFQLVNGATNQRLGELTPIRQPATITHDTSRNIKRDLRIALPVADATAINPLTDRVAVWTHLGGVAYPLGRYMFTDPTTLTSTGGNPGLYTLLDEMFLVDQQLDQGFTSTGSVDSAVRALLEGLPLVGVLLEPTVYPAVGGWTAGTTRGQVLATLAEQGDYQTPWMDHQGRFRMVRTVDPDQTVADLDLDSGQRVVVNSIGQTSDILHAPNRFVVIGNGAGAADIPVTGTYDVPPNAPHSITNRGFVIPDVYSAQVDSATQAKAMARARGLQQTIFVRAELETPPDPRHDSYQTIHWQGANWLELAWSMTCEDGAGMRHSLRRNVKT